MLPYQEQESADVTFEGGPLEVEIELMTQSVVKTAFWDALVDSLRPASAQ